MNWGLLLSVIKNMVLPEITAYIQSRHAATGQFPTAEEVEAYWIAKLKADVDKIQSEGQAFLDATRPPTPSGG